MGAAFPCLQLRGWISNTWANRVGSLTLWTIKPGLPPTPDVDGWDREESNTPLPMLPQDRWVIGTAFLKIAHNLRACAPTPVLTGLTLMYCPGNWTSFLNTLSLRLFSVCFQHMFCRIVTKVNAYERSFVSCVYNYKSLILGSMLQTISVILLWYSLCIGCSDPYIYPTEKAVSLGLPPDSENIILKQLLLPGSTQRQLLCSGELVPLLSVICVCLLCMRMWFQRLLLLFMWLLHQFCWCLVVD